MLFFINFFPLFVFLLTFNFQVQCEHWNYSASSLDQEAERARFCQESKYTSRYHKETQKCYKMPSQGPCDSTMLFLGDDSNDLYGSCQCKESNRLAAYYPPHKKCYTVYQQGYCPTGYILTPLRNGSPKVECLKDPCHDLKTPGTELFHLNGRCVELYSKCGEERRDGILEDKIVQIAEDGATINCLIRRRSSPYAFSAIATKCPRGTFRAIPGQKCSGMLFRTDEWQNTQNEAEYTGNIYGNIKQNSRDKSQWFKPVRATASWALGVSCPRGAFWYKITQKCVNITPKMCNLMQTKFW